MNNGSVVINVTFSFQNDEEVMLEQKWKKSQILYQKNKEKKREYAQRPEVKARKRECEKKRYQRNKEKIKEYAQRPEVKARGKNMRKKGDRVEDVDN